MVGPTLGEPNNDLIVDGDVVVRHRGTVLPPGTRIHLDRETGSIFVHNNEGNIVYQWQMPDKNLRFAGDLVIHNQRASNLMDANQAVFHLDSQRGAAIIGGNQFPGQIVCRDADNNQTIFLNGAEGDIYAGANGKDGNIFVQNADNEVMIHLNGDKGNVRTRSLSLGSTSGTSTSLGGNNGSLFILAPGALIPTIQFNAQNSFMQVGNIQLEGGNSRMLLGDIQLEGGNSRMLLGDALRLDGDKGNIWVGGKKRDGDIVLFPASATDLDNLSQASIHLNGDAGDIIFRNADCAEEFDVLEEVEPGTVMVFDAGGKLRQSTDAYDKRVAGVISGAGDYKPGIVLDRQQSSNTRMPVALMGKVYCKVDTQYGAIEVGDLLTTSPTPGHAMKADDPVKAFGSVIGKALQGYNQGQGLLPILACLQ